MNDEATILIVEDSPEDYEACVTALTKDNNIVNPIVWCETGDDALDYLHRRGDFAGGTYEMPGLVLLDLNLPGTDGRDVLQSIKDHEATRKLPVVVMTSSGEQTDIDRCYDAGANSYVVKPVDLERFLGAISRLRDYWLKIVVLPRNE